MEAKQPYLIFSVQLTSKNTASTVPSSLKEDSENKIKNPASQDEDCYSFLK